MKTGRDRYEAGESIFVDVNRFREACGFEASKHVGPARLLDECDVELHAKLIDEEVNQELLKALRNGDIEGIADGIMDSLFVICGLALHMNLPIAELWCEVCGANMEKAGGPKRADGKQLKPEGWRPPNIRKILEDDGYVFPE